MASSIPHTVSAVGMARQRGFSPPELAAAAGTSVATVARLIRLGLLEPAEGAAEYSSATAARLRRMLRLHRDLGANMIGAAIILDLVERLERLQSEMTRRRRFP